MMGGFKERSARSLAGQPWKVLLGLALFAGAIDLVNHLIVSALGAQVSFWWTFFKTIVWWASYIPLLALALLLADRYRLDRGDGRRNLLIHLLAAVGFAYVHTAANALVDAQWLTAGAAFLPRLFRIVRVNFPIDFVSYWAIVGAHYYSELHQREVAAAELKAATAELEASLVEARLRALRSQLNPHFLFNTLNAVSTLALKGEPRAVSRMLSRLSGLLRVCLDDEGPQLVSLGRELDFLRGYLEIQQLLLGERLTVEYRVTADAFDAVVPRMILQPILENAIVHGIAPREAPGRIDIEAGRENGRLRLTVTDNGAGFGTAAPRPGIGFSNTEARLAQLYGEGGRLEYGRSTSGGAAVTLQIPFIRDMAEAASA